ncbi:M15 family metallopeptidase [Aliarcobacter butzleri]|uniref:M15 family metallopeptidase n=1 Tax=Aliarcobacter butzleri TaxID=28197 RepID=UPI003AF62704
MKNRLFFLIFLSINLFADENLAQKLIKAYPNFLKEYSNNQIIWNDDTKMIFDEKKEYKSYEDSLNNASLKEQLTTKYIKVKENKNYIPNFNEDAGRARFEPFFQKMYGKTQKDVEKNLVKIKWLPKSQNKTLAVTKINDVDKKLEAISNELENLPLDLKKFVLNPSGVYNYRKISRTNRLSVHSFGIAIDINLNFSNYWQWDEKDGKIEYKNKIPLEIVEIFEKYGFIWGGRWYHFDTMHFEYRPELLVD